MTTPGNPSSAAIRLVPPPMMACAVRLDFASCNVSASASTVETSASIRAGPPISKRVWRASGAFTKSCTLGIAERRKSISSDYMFPPEAITFLKGLEKHNTRDWFQPRKEIFDAKVKEPMLAFVETINAELLKFAPEHITEPKKAVYRIYRDTQFSKDKTPYKTHLGAIFPRRGLGRDAGAGFYFHVSAKEVGVACGSYGPGPEELKKIRHLVAENDKVFRAMSAKLKKLMGPLKGTTLTRVPKGF